MDEWRPSKLLDYCDRPEYWEESWRLEEACCHSNSGERLSANADVKNSQGVNNNNKTWTWLRKENLKIETESYQNITIRTNYIKIDPIYPTPPLGKDMKEGQFF